jgi:solute carrier family 25 (adenine nucleotide translocator) protein 4/5/6/31
MSTVKPHAPTDSRVAWGAACVAVSVAKTITAPLDRTKLLLQTTAIAPRKQQPGVLCAASKRLSAEVRSEGLGVLWRGNVASVLRVLIGAHTHMAARSVLRDVERRRGREARFAESALLGGIAGGAAVCVTQPFDYVRTHLACDVSGRGTAALLRDAMANGGVRVAYRGMHAAMAGALVYRGVQYGLYDALRGCADNGSFKFNFGAAWCATVVAGIAAYPLDTIRRRMMMHPAASPRMSAVVCMCGVLQSEGAARLFSGALVNTFRGLACGGSLAAADVILAVALQPHSGRVLDSPALPAIE